MNKKIHFIINPASGRPYPILNTINSVCHKHDCRWTVAVSQPDNLNQLAQEAAKSDAEIIAVYGGDGTLAEVASALIGSDKLLGILPGGTANVLSVELGIPQNIAKACILLSKNDTKHKKVDIGQVNDKYFLLRVGLGFEAEAVKEADRSFKNKVGVLAYALSSFRAILKTKFVTYDLVLDGQHQTCKGLSLVVANSGNLGLPGISLLPAIDVTDGYLDVILIRTTDLQKLFDFEEKGLTWSENLALFKHWRVKRLSVKPLSNQPIHYDGEILESSNLNIEIHPQALKIIIL